MEVVPAAQLPHYDDRARYNTMLREGLVPVIDSHLRHLGGAIGIHGTDRPSFNRVRINWTLGCISVDNDTIEELDRVLPVGTLVIIKQ
jgi:lipoprotein-anchoring transpeptidase ErfK/SrfK